MSASSEASEPKHSTTYIYAAFAAAKIERLDEIVEDAAGGRLFQSPQRGAGTGLVTRHFTDNARQEQLALRKPFPGWSCESIGDLK